MYGGDGAESSTNEETTYDCEEDTDDLELGTELNGICCSRRRSRRGRCAHRRPLGGFKGELLQLQVQSTDPLALISQACALNSLGEQFAV